MNRYDFYLFVHVMSVILWIGGGAMLTFNGIRAEAARDDAEMGRIVSESAYLGPRLFAPASLVTVIFGVLMVVDGPWSFSYLWITLGLLGFLATFGTGMGVLKPRSERIDALIAEDGGMSPRALLESRQLLTLARIDYIVLVLVVADMTLKPTGDDVGLLVVMAAVLVAGVGWTLQSARSIKPDRRTTSPAAG